MNHDHRLRPLGYLLLGGLLMLSPGLPSQAEESSPVLVAPLVGGASVQALTLDDALDEAFQANPLLNAARQQEPVAQGGIILAKTRVNPKLNLLAAPVETTYHPVDMDITVQLGGKRELRVRVAQYQLASANAQIRTTAWKVRQDTEQAFYEYAVSQKALSVLRDYQQIAEGLVEIAKKRQAVGDLSGLDVFRAEAALLDVQTLLPPASARVRQAQRQLNLLMNRSSQAPLTIVAPATLQLQDAPDHLPAFESLMAQAKVSRPEYRQYQADIDTQKARVRLANSAKWPDIQIGGGLSMVPQSRNNAYWGENFSYGPEMYAQIPIPVLDHQQGPKAIAQASAAQLIAQRQAFDNQVQQELSLAYSNLEGASEQLKLFVTQLLPKQKEIVVTSQKSFRIGFIDSTAAITAQQNALLARTSALQTLTRYFQARVELERAVGHPIDYDHPQAPERVP